jgi:hypothetical protein
VIGKGKSEVAGLGGGFEVGGAEIVDDPIGASGEEIGVGGRGAKSEDAGARGLSGTRAGRSVFDNDAGLRMEMKGRSAFKVRLGIGLAADDVAGGNEMLDMRPELGGPETNFSEGAGGGSNDGELRRGDGGEKFGGAGEGDDVVDVFDFGAFHPFVFGKMDGGIGVGEKFLNGSETGAAMGSGNGEFGIEIVLAGPTHPDASDGGSGVDEDAVHVEEQRLT